MDERSKKRRLRKQPSVSRAKSRPEKRQATPTLVPQYGSANTTSDCNEVAVRSDFCGQGIQHSGPGNFVVQGNVNIGVRNDPQNNHQYLSDLRITDPRHDKARIEQAKGGLLYDSYSWILDNADFQQWCDNQQNRLLWIKGEPGKGKTMLLCGIIDELEKAVPHSNNLSYFFCQATDSRINTATAVLRGLLYLLVSQQPSLISHVREKYDNSGKTLFEDVNAWFALSEIFRNILQDSSLNSVYLIVDALDECVAGLPKLLEFIVNTLALSPRVKWLVSSRNELYIEQKLRFTDKRTRLSLELKGNAQQVSRAVDVYINDRLSRVESLQDDDIRNQVRDILHKKANGTFLWVAFIIQELEHPESIDPLQVVKEVQPGLHELYDRMLNQIQNLKRHSKLCQLILSIVTIVYRPLHLTEIGGLCELQGPLPELEKIVRKIVAMCGSFLTVQDDQIYIVHQSVKDYLFKEVSHEPLLPGIVDIHYLVFSRSLQAMSKSLRRDMYRLCALGYPADQVEPPDPDPLAGARYSCIYWIDHLCDWCLGSSATSSADLEDGGAIHEFIRKKYLYWLEALSLCKSMSRGIVSMAKLEMLVKRRTDASALNKLVRDARRFIMSHKRAIEDSPLQAYASALLFSPIRSLIRGLFKREEPNWFIIEPAMQDKWSPCLQTLEGHSDAVTAIAFSHDSARLASASDDGTVKIWDASSGECLLTLEGHSGRVNSVPFSHDSTRLASGSQDNTVIIWDASSGECLLKLGGHSSWVTSVTFSHDSVRLASGSEDNTVKLWDSSSGECLRTLEGHSNSVTSVGFSHNSVQLASASEDGTVKLWDVNSGECLQTFEPYSPSWCVIYLVAFSHDSAWLASASTNIIVKIWDASNGECLQTLRGHINPIVSVAFSHDSARLASASKDSTVKIWDVSSGECLQTLEGHSGIVLSVAFSRDSMWLASASTDKTVKIWDTSSDECPRMLQEHGDIIRSVAFSHDSARMVSASDDGTVKIWDAISGECLQTLEHGSPLISVVFSQDSTRLASASHMDTVKIWDASNGECLQTVRGHNSNTFSVAFSQDSARLASSSVDRTVKIWDTSSGECLQTLEIYHPYIWDSVYSVAFSHDSAWLASGSTDHTVKIWDLSSGKCLQTLEGHSGTVTSVSFSHDSAWVASGSEDNTVKLWDASSGECFQTLSIGTELHRISFNISSSSLHTDIGTIEIHVPPGVLSQLPSSIELQNPQYQGLALSAERVWITYNSENLVWLPVEYRSACSAVLGKRIGVGVGRGRVWIFNVRLEML